MIKEFSKLAFGIAAGIGAGYLAFVAGVAYGATGTVDAYRNDPDVAKEIEEEIDKANHTIKALGEKFQ